MQLHVDPNSPLPLYAQLVDQFRQAIATGKLAPGDALPTVRQLAVDLRVNMHTVARAYNELSREGLIAMRRGLGTTVVARPRPPEPEERERRVSEIIREALAEAAALGLSSEEFLRALTQHVREQT
ncbi:MAG: GntR family transcriptional regulator [Armatimonadetes bacterium]|nr:GntR family transcriptional regulator [Armatimonadota bacterium]